jgi:hypothetical protein
MKGSDVMNPLILSLDTSYRWAVSGTFRWTSLRYQLDRSPRSSPEILLNRNISDPTGSRTNITRCQVGYTDHAIANQCDGQHVKRLNGRKISRSVIQSKVNPSLYRPWKFHKNEAPRFPHGRDMKVAGLSDQRTYHIYPPGNTSGTYLC